MSDPQKTTAAFAFGQPATSGSSGGLFGQAGSTAPKPVGSLFGSATNSPATSAANPFGNTSTTGGNALFGNAPSTSQPSAFSGGTSVFGGGNKPPGGEWSFGQTESQNNQQSSNAAPSMAFPAFSTPNKPSETSAVGQSQPSSVFSGGGGPGNFSFGNLGPNTSSTGQNNNTTPTSKPTTNLFGNSTTPAGPPPGTSTGAGAGAGAGSVLFGKPPQDAANPFANLGPSSSAPNTSLTTGSSGGFGGFNFGSSKSQESAATTSSTQSSSIFGSAPNSGGSSLFGNKRGVQPEGGLFNNTNKIQDTGSTKPATSQQPPNEASKPSSLFPNVGGQSSANNPVAQTTSPSLFAGATSKPSFNFTKTDPSQPTSSNPVASPTAAPTLFSGYSSQPSSSATSAPSNSLFPSLGKPQDKAPATSAKAAITSTPSSSAPASAFSLFNKPATSSATSQAPTQSAATNTAEGTGAANADLGASTAGPPPAAQSRLKNKSMDEIITRWATDLSKYQKQFQGQAEKVANWDRMLVENSDKIQRLYGSTLEAERATTEVERQLTVVENDQFELDNMLSDYEKEVDSLTSNQVGQSESLSGPDQERERT